MAGEGREARKAFEREERIVLWVLREPQGIMMLCFLVGVYYFCSSALYRGVGL